VITAAIPPAGTAAPSGWRRHPTRRPPTRGQHDPGVEDLRGPVDHQVVGEIFRALHGRRSHNLVSTGPRRSLHRDRAGPRVGGRRVVVLRHPEARRFRPAGIAAVITLVLFSWRRPSPTTPGGSTPSYSRRRDPHRAQAGPAHPAPRPGGRGAGADHRRRGGDRGAAPAGPGRWPRSRCRRSTMTWPRPSPGPGRSPWWPASTRAASRPAGQPAILAGTTARPAPSTATGPAPACRRPSAAPTTSVLGPAPGARQVGHRGEHRPGAAAAAVHQASGRSPSSATAWASATTSRGPSSTGDRAAHQLGGRVATAARLLLTPRDSEARP